jgi:KaiC/GvpD/RAD55 family RecA-like ATPase
MSDDTAVLVAKKLEELGPSVAVALEFSMANYFDVLRGLINNFAGAKKLNVIYITSTLPATTIQSTLDTLEVDASHIYIIDTISQMIMSKRDFVSDRIVYVESPTTLENVVLKVEYLNRHIGGGAKLVVVDSINSMAIHNDTKMLSEFLRVLISGLSDKEAYPVVLSIQGASRADVSEMLYLVCDQVINLESPE